VSVKKVKTGYQVSWRSADGRRHRETFRTQKAANQHERDMRDLREQGVTTVGRKSTLAEFVRTYQRDVYPRLRANTTKGYDLVLARHILPVFGETRLQDIDQRRVQDWVNDLADHGKRVKGGQRGPMAPRTVEACFAVLSSILSVAAEYGYARPVPRAGRGRAGVRLPKVHMTRRTPATLEQIYRLGYAIDDDVGPAFVYLAGFCGLRISEILGMHPSAVDFDRHRIHVWRTKEQATASIVDMTKSGKDRYVTMTQPVEDAMRQHLAEYPHPDLVFHRNGRSFDASNFHKTVWKPTRDSVGLPNVTVHTLRHSAASIMIANGWSAKRVQRELGHHSAAFTLDRYGHEFDLREEDPGRDMLTDALTKQLERARRSSEEVPQDG